MHKLAALALLASLTLACDKGDSTSSDASSSGAGTESGASNSNSNSASNSDSNDSGPTEVSGGTDSTSGDLPTSAGSVTTPTGPTGDPTADPTGETQGQTVTSANPTSDPTSDPTTDPTGADPDEAATQLCVDTINMYRATLSLPPLARWFDAEVCSDGEAASDGMIGTPHGAFGMCGEFAQNECPGWPGPPESMITDCLAQMWAEGPGDDFPTHGHYINMSNPSYTQVTCGFAEVNGEIWAVQDFK